MKYDNQQPEQQISYFILLNTHVLKLHLYIVDIDS